MTPSEEVRRACSRPMTAEEVARMVGRDVKAVRYTLDQQCYNLWMAKTHDVPAKYVTLRTFDSPRPRRADALSAIKEGWTPTPDVARSVGIPGRRAYEVMKRAERRGLVERRHASANLVEWKLTERGMEMMEGMEKMEVERWRRRRP